MYFKNVLKTKKFLKSNFLKVSSFLKWFLSAITRQKHKIMYHEVFYSHIEIFQCILGGKVKSIKISFFHTFFSENGFYILSLTKITKKQQQNSVPKSLLKSYWSISIKIEKQKIFLKLECGSKIFFKLNLQCSNAI